jgi:hypothetical protein
MQPVINLQTKPGLIKNSMVLRSILRLFFSIYIQLFRIITEKDGGQLTTVFFLIKFLLN